MIAPLPTALLPRLLLLLLASSQLRTASAKVTIHNSSGCCCGNIYPRSAANLVSTVDECTANCAADPLCHAAIMITGAGEPDPAKQVQDQCQLKGPAPAGKACCIHKPHFDGLSGWSGGTVIDMGTSSGPCECKNNGYDKPCDAPVPKTCLMYGAKGANQSGAFGPCSGSRAPGPPPPPYELYRPIYHLTPQHGHNNDPNGMFHDSVHDRFHVFVQWAPLNPADKTPRAWGHFSAPSLAGPWERYPLYYTDANHTHPEVSGCSGGATIAPDGTPTLVICGGDTAVPANRSDPMLSHWVQTNVDVTETGSPPAYFPLNIPGKWDCSVYREPSGRYRVTFGSCTMFNGTLRPHQGTGYCDGSKQDGLPQVLSYVSEDFKTWSYLGEQWRGDGGAMSGRRWGPRVECPYQINVRNHTLLKISAVAFGHDFLFVGSTTGNGSAFVPDEGTAQGPGANGIEMDFGDMYAAAVLHHKTHGVNRHLYLGWVKCAYRFDAATAGFDSALSLPRVMDVDDATGAPTWDVPADAVEPLRIGPPVVKRALTLAPGATLPLELPQGATGDALEVRLNFSQPAAASDVGPIGLQLRRTADGSEGVNVTYEGGCSASGLVVSTMSKDPLSQGQQVRKAPSVPTVPGVLYSLRVFVDKSVIEAHLGTPAVVRSVTTRHYPLNLDAKSGAFGLAVMNAAAMEVVVESVEVWGMRGIY